MHWQNKIADSKGDMKRLWRVLHSALGEKYDEETIEHTADECGTFFKTKVDSIRASTAVAPLYQVPCRETGTLSEWTPVTAEKI